MKVSVIMPVYNRQDYVKEAIDSILHQTMGDLELIVIDDKSTDHTADIVRDIHDDRIRFIEAPFKSNIPILRNAGISMAKGQYIAFMDSDDISVPERLEWECDFLDHHDDYGLVGGFNHTFGQADSIVEFPVTNEDISGGMAVRCVMSNGNMLFRKSLIDQGFHIKPEYFVCEDYDFFCQMIGHTKMANLPQVVLNVRYHTRQTTSNSWKIPYQLRLRAAILHEIHRMALTNLRLTFTEEELTLYSDWMGDTARLYTASLEKIQKLEKLLDKFEDQLAAENPSYLNGFRQQADRKLKKLYKK